MLPGLSSEHSRHSATNRPADISKGKVTFFPDNNSQIQEFFCTFEPMSTPLSTAKRKTITRLQQSRRRHESGLFVIEGSKSVADTAGLFECVMIAASPTWLEANNASAYGTSEVYTATTADLRAMSSLATPPDVMAICRMPVFQPDYTDMQSRLVVALDGIQDPGNLGTIVRSCDWFGVNDILCSQSTVDIYNSKAIQATMGSLARVRVHYVDLSEALTHFAPDRLFGTFLDGTDIYSTPLPACGVIVMGNEGNGVSESISRMIQQRLFIPPGNPDAPHVESLNVGIATAVVLSQFQNSRVKYGQNKK